MIKTTPPTSTPVRRPPSLQPLAALAGALAIAACSLPLQQARMALPANLANAGQTQVQPFQGLGSGRSGQFVFEGQTVSFRRSGDALSVFERVQLDRLSVAFEHAGAQVRCDGRATGVTAGLVDAALKPLALACRFSGSVAGELTLTERRLAAAGTRRAREGQARLGALVIEIRSEHGLAGTPLPLSQPAGYRLLIEGRDVAALDLAGAVPVLHRALHLDAPARAAITQLALALGLLFEPAASQP